MSLGGRISFPLNSPYHATKFALEGLSESIQYELEPFGIKIIVIEPGGVGSNFLKNLKWASDEVISQHANAIKPTVLISPSLHTGLDLKNKLSRFQIITKVPYPNKSDRWTNAKRKVDEEWYYWQTVLKLIQAYGRSVRSKDDWAKTYILDSAFSYFVKKNMNILPDWFRQAIRT